MIQFPPSLKVTRAGVISLITQIEFGTGLEMEADENEDEFTFWMALTKLRVNVEFWIH
jgi:hypothetical protein